MCLSKPRAPSILLTVRAEASPGGDVRELVILREMEGAIDGGG